MNVATEHRSDVWGAMEEEAMQIPLDPVAAAAKLDASAELAAIEAMDALNPQEQEQEQEHQLEQPSHHAAAAENATSQPASSQEDPITTKLPLHHHPLDAEEVGSGSMADGVVVDGQPFTIPGGWQYVPPGLGINPMSNSGMMGMMGALSGMPFPGMPFPGMLPGFPGMSPMPMPLDPTAAMPGLQPPITPLPMPAATPAQAPGVPDIGTQQQPAALTPSQPAVAATVAAPATTSPDQGSIDPNSIVTGVPLAEFAQNWQMMLQQQQSNMMWSWWQNCMMMQGMQGPWGAAGMMMPGMGLPGVGQDGMPMMPPGVQFPGFPGAAGMMPGANCMMPGGMMPGAANGTGAMGMAGQPGMPGMMPFMMPNGMMMPTDPMGMGMDMSMMLPNGAGLPGFDGDQIPIGDSNPVSEHEHDPEQEHDIDDDNILDDEDIGPLHAEVPKDEPVIPLDIPINRPGMVTRHARAAAAAAASVAAGTSQPSASQAHTATPAALQTSTAVDSMPTSTSPDKEITVPPPIALPSTLPAPTSTLPASTSTTPLAGQLPTQPPRISAPGLTLPNALVSAANALKRDGPSSMSIDPAAKRGRRIVKEQVKPGNENKICKNCGTRTTPFWRKDKHDGRPLCNACGLYFSKNDAPRPKILWKAEEGCVMDGVEGQFGLDQPPPSGPNNNTASNTPGNTPHASAPGAANGSGPSHPPANPPGMPNVMIVAAAAAQQSLSQSGCTPAPLAVAHALQCAAVDNPAVAQALAAAGMPGVTLPGAKGGKMPVLVKPPPPPGITQQAAAAAAQAAANAVLKLTAQAQQAKAAAAAAAAALAAKTHLNGSALGAAGDAGAGSSSQPAAGSSAANGSEAATAAKTGLPANLTPAIAQVLAAAVAASGAQPGSAAANAAAAAAAAAIGKLPPQILKDLAAASLAKGKLTLPPGFTFPKLPLAAVVAASQKPDASKDAGSVALGKGNRTSPAAPEVKPGVKGSTSASQDKAASQPPSGKGTTPSPSPAPASQAVKTEAVTKQASPAKPAVADAGTSRPGTDKPETMEID